MNFLAHNYLSFQQPGLIVGNYLGDFLRNQEVKKLPLPIKAGVILHRKIDSFTDHHPVVREGTALLHNTMGKYAPVVLDIYFDFLLSRNWHDFHNHALSEFCDISYDVLLKHRDSMSERVAARMEKMVSDRWLEKYQSYRGLERIFDFLHKRAKFESNLVAAPVVLRSLQDQLENIFLRFFPDIIVFARSEAGVPITGQ